MITVFLFGALVVLGIVIGVLNKTRTNRADKLLERGDLTGALSEYKQLFINSFVNVIDEDGNGHIPAFLAILKNQGTNYLGKINAVLGKNGTAVIDMAIYGQLVAEVEEFSKQKGVMNFKQAPVGEGKTRFAEFYHRLMSFAQEIPDRI